MMSFCVCPLIIKLQQEVGCLLEGIAKKSTTYILFSQDKTKLQYLILNVLDCAQYKQRSFVFITVYILN